MKKTLALLLAMVLTMALALSACGGSTAQDTDEQDTELGIGVQNAENEQDTDEQDTVPVQTDDSADTIENTWKAMCVADVFLGGTLGTGVEVQDGKTIFPVMPDWFREYYDSTYAQTETEANSEYTEISWDANGNTAVSYTGDAPQMWPSNAQTDAFMYCLLTILGAPMA